MPRKEVIGNCTLYHDDSVELLESLGGVDVLMTDPPYGMAFQSNYRTIKHEKIANDEGIGHLQWACSLEAAHSKYIFCRWDNIYQLPKPKSLIIWVKNNWSMGDLNHEHARQTEVALFYPGPNHAFTKERPTDVIKAPRTGNDNHPTEKPVQLMMAMIGWTTGRVVDPFMGSGTTGVACQRLGRAFIGVEIDQKHFDTACRRVEEAYAAPDMFAANDNKDHAIAA